jgi:hypothetical protein
VYELIVPVLVETVLLAACKPLIKLLTIILVNPSEKRSTPWMPRLKPVWQATSRAQLASAYAGRAYSLGICGDSNLPPPRAAMTQSCWILPDASLNRKNRAEAREDARRPNTVRERLSDIIVDHLLLLCKASDDNNLPPVYHQ